MSIFTKSTIVFSPLMCFFDFLNLGSLTTNNTNRKKKDKYLFKHFIIKFRTILIKKELKSNEIISVPTLFENQRIFDGLGKEKAINHKFKIMARPLKNPKKNCLMALPMNNFESKINNRFVSQIQILI